MGPPFPSAGRRYNLLTSQGNQQETFSTSPRLPDVPPVLPHLPSPGETPWGPYLAGLMEGDGSLGPQRCDIVFRERDTSLASRLRSVLGHGSLSPVKQGRGVKLSLDSDAGRRRLVELCAGHWVGPSQVASMARHGYGVSPSAFSGSVDLSTPWLAGFFDADGSLSLDLIPSTTHRLGLAVRLRFRISQKDPFLLRALLAAVPSSTLHGSGGAYRWGVTHRSLGVPFLIHYFDRHHLRSGKFLEYYYFRKAFLITQGGEHLCPEGLRRLRHLKEKMEALRASARKGSSETTRQAPREIFDLG